MVILRVVDSPFPANTFQRRIPTTRHLTVSSCLPALQQKCWQLNFTSRKEKLARLSSFFSSVLLISEETPPVVLMRVSFREVNSFKNDGNVSPLVFIA